MSYQHLFIKCNCVTLKNKFYKKFLPSLQIYNSPLYSLLMINSTIKSKSTKIHHYQHNFYQIIKILNIQKCLIIGMDYQKLKPMKKYQEIILLISYLMLHKPMNSNSSKEKLVLKKPLDPLKEILFLKPVQTFKLKLFLEINSIMYYYQMNNFSMMLNSIYHSNPLDLINYKNPIYHLNQTLLNNQYL